MTTRDELSWRTDVKTYIEKHGVTEALNRAVEQVIKERPSDPCAAIGRMLGGSDAATSQLPTSTAVREYTDLHQLEQKLSRAASKAVAENGPVPLQRIAALLLEEEAATAPQSGQSLPTALDAAVRVVAAAAPSDLVAFLKERLAAVGDPESAEKEGGGPAKPSGAEGTAPAAPIASAPRRALRRPSLSPTSEDATIAALDGESIVARLCAEPTLVAVGEPVQGGSWAYRGGAFGNDGLLYLTPAGASRAVRFNPADGSHTPIGDDLGKGDEWAGGVLCDDGCIYALPGKAARALRIDPAQGTAAPFGDDLTGLGFTGQGSAFGWFGTVAGPDGMLYGIPHNSAAVLCFDPATGKASAFGELGKGETKYVDGVLASDGCIYAAPHGAKRALRIDPVARTATMIGDELAVKPHRWLTGAVGGDGCLYFPPCDASRVLRIDPTTQTVELIGDELGGGWKWWGAFPNPDGCVYCVPFTDKQLLRIDPLAGTVARVGPSLQDKDRHNLLGHATAADGTVWALPSFSSPVGAAPHRVELPPARQLLAALLRGHGDALRSALRSAATGSRLLTMIAAQAGGAEHGTALARGCLQVGAAALPARMGEAPARRALAAALEGVCWGEVTLAAVGEPVQGGVPNQPYAGGAFGNDGLLYLTPAHASRVVRFSPADGSHTPIGDDLGEKDCSLSGSVLCDDGCIYALPNRASRALRIDPAQGTAAPFGDDLAALGATSFSWSDTIAGPDGMLYGIPHEAGAVLCFDPATGKASVFGDLGDGRGKGFYRGGVLAPDGCIYAAPRRKKRALRIDPVARTATMIGDEIWQFEGVEPDGWVNGVVGGDGCLYFLPQYASRALRIDPTAQTVELIGDELGEGGRCTWAFPGPDGCVYGVPHTTAHQQLLRIDPCAGTASRVGPPLQDKDRNNLRGYTTEVNGTVWALPANCAVAPHRIDLPHLPPFAALVPILADDAALCSALSCDKLRPQCAPILGAAFSGANPDAEQLSLRQLVRTKLHPAFAAAAARGFAGGRSLSSETHVTALDAIAKVSPFLTGLVPWSPAPTSTADWVRPAKQPAAAPLLAALKAAENEGPASLDAAWPILAPVGAEAIARLVVAVRASKPAKAVLLELYEQARKMSLENYRGALLRCRREPTFFEYENQSNKLRTALVERAKACRQLETSFPRLIQQAAAIEPTFIEFVELLAQRTRATAAVPPAKPSRQGGRCLKGAWRALEKMALRPGALPADGLASEISVETLGELLDASRLFDLLRGSVKCTDFTQLVAVLDLLQLLDDELGNKRKAESMGLELERFAIRLHRLKCRFTTPTSGGWADALINFSFVHDPHAHVCELQLQHEALLVIRKEGKAHEAYSDFRSAFEVLEATGAPPPDVFDESGAADELSPIDMMKRKLAATDEELAATKEKLAATKEELAATKQELAAFGERMAALEAALKR